MIPIFKMDYKNQVTWTDPEKIQAEYCLGFA